MTRTNKSKLENIKESSNYLRGNLTDELKKDSSYFTKEGLQLLKFHGTYQQDDRDLRNGKDRFYMFMVRIRLPGGRMTSDQYLVHDEIADIYGNGTLRITTRQTFQFHGIIKDNLQKTIRGINNSLVTTLGACGDVVRNVMSNPAPDEDGKQLKIQKVADRLSRLLLPETKAYHELWLNGEKVYSNREEVSQTESLYGKAYLPRKFKIAITKPGDNSIDLYTQDIGLVAFFNEKNEIEGFDVIVGGGMGMNHRKLETYPRLGDHLGYIPCNKLIPLVTSIIEIQRDHGDRRNRKHARMKYLIDDWGFEIFKKEVENKSGFKLEPFKLLPEFTLNLYLGWHKQSDGNWYIGLPIENGRIKDDGKALVKTGLRNIIRKYNPEVRLTPNQNILLTNIEESDKGLIEDELKSFGIKLSEEQSNIVKYAMACPALPTCGLAITESERIFPGILRDLEKVVEDLGLENDKITVRMTGCPNGCSRPYVADIGFVGRSKNKYSVFIGGDTAGTRLNKKYKDLVDLEDLVDTVQPFLEEYASNHKNGESFSDYWNRKDPESIKDTIPS
ncbi:MAG TPA: NADPH-dependent assimilatory sulfite reductase hemoprotein subunit [Balneolales bacterium]|nr:NADPH-dependent assimilatory sulfite reductase hemoprotein subunit [Balneolales bacterium]